jgi:hypothetical protein
MSPSILYALLGALALYIYWRWYSDRLRKFLGPPIATWTNAWRVYEALTRNHTPDRLICLHRKYGDVVRIGPKTLSFSDPRAIRDIYGTDKHYPKSEFYWTAAVPSQGRVNPSLFSGTDGPGMITYAEPSIQRSV